VIAGWATCSTAHRLPSTRLRPSNIGLSPSCNHVSIFQLSDSLLVCTDGRTMCNFFVCVEMSLTYINSLLWSLQSADICYCCLSVSLSPWWSVKLCVRHRQISRSSCRVCKFLFNSRNVRFTFAVFMSAQWYSEKCENTLTVFTVLSGDCKRLIMILR